MKVVAAETQVSSGDACKLSPRRIRFCYFVTAAPHGVRHMLRESARVEVKLFAGPMCGKTVDTGGAEVLVYPEPLPNSICPPPLPCEHRYDGRTGEYRGRFRPGGLTTI